MDVLENDLFSCYKSQNLKHNDTKEKDWHYPKYLKKIISGKDLSYARLG